MIAERPTVLVVDDDRNTRETLKRGLSRAGYDVLTAVSTLANAEIMITATWGRTTVAVAASRRPSIPGIL
ncbi:MAG: hypothetical protein ACYTDU_17605 [Planctomycetota bacterium]|jgi:DNA-binding response OmpR family regulator